ncbi:MAG: hypothetical protein K8U57_28445 [Planctomycetes bacterium]|nr:hypothetical protein [Planctomycetota bacterium]
MKNDLLPLAPAAPIVPQTVTHKVTPDDVTRMRDVTVPMKPDALDEDPKDNSSTLNEVARVTTVTVLTRTDAQSETHKDDSNASNEVARVTTVTELSKPDASDGRCHRLWKAIAGHAGRIFSAALDRTVALLLAQLIVIGLKRVANGFGIPRP